MAFKFNPLAFSSFDIVSGGGSPWTSTVPTEAALPALGTQDGEAKVVLDTDHIYIWDQTTLQWIDTGFSVSTFSAVGNAAGMSLSINDKGNNVTEQLLVMHPATATQPGGVSILAQSFAGNKTFVNDVTVTGDLTVNGTTTTINTANLTVEDKNITINFGGNDATSEGAGLTIERAGTDGSLVYETALTSKFKIGDLASESEILTAGHVQTITANKTMSGTLNMSALTATRPLKVDASNNVISGLIDLASATDVTGIVPIANGGTALATTPLSGQLLIGDGVDYTLATLTATLLQTTVTNGAGSITIGTVQDIDTTSSPEFTGLNISGVTATRPLKVNATNDVVSGLIDLASATDVTGIVPIANGGTALSTTPLNGQLLIGDGVDYTLTALTGTANQVVVTNGAGSITLSTPQDIAVASSPEFAGLTLTSFSGVVKAVAGVLSASLIVDADVSGTAAINATKIADGSVTNTEFQYINTLSSNAQTQLDAKLDDFTSTSDNRIVRTDGTAGEAVQDSGVTIDDSDVVSGITQLNAGNIRIDGDTISNQNLNSGITIQPNGTGSINLPTLTASLPLKLDASKNVITAQVDLTSEITGILPIANGGTALSTAATNGQLLIGNGTGYTLATITGDTDQVTVTNAAGTITLSTPQDINTTSDMTFGSVNNTSTTVASTAYPVMTTGERNGTTPAEGQGVYNTTTDRLNIYNGSAWIEVPTMSSGDVAETEVAFTESETDTTIFTIGAGVRSAKVFISLFLDATAKEVKMYELTYITDGAGFYDYTISTNGNGTVALDMLAGAVRYTSGTYAGFVGATSKFKYRVISTTI